MARLPTIITAVTVYPDRARVTRRGSMAVNAGMHRLEIPELPLQLEPESVRATVRSSAKARFMGVQVERMFFVETPSEQLHQLEDQIEALEDEGRGLQAKAELLKGTKTNLSDLAGRTETYAMALAAGEMGVDEQLSLFDSLRNRAEELDKELLEIAAQQRNQERNIAKLKKDSEQWRGAPRQEANAAIVEVDAQEDGELAIELSYVISGASWRPLYDLRLVEEGSEARLEMGYLAQVSQRSGEEWNEIDLALSTARPALAVKSPELDPWYIGPMSLPQPLAAPRMVAAAMPAREAGGTSEVPAQLAKQPAEELSAELESSGAAIVYRVPAKINLRADGSSHKVLVSRISLKPKLDYVSAPKKVDAAYRRAKLVNDSPYTLLPGQANIFVGDEFIGITNLELTPPGGEIELYLGVDDRIHIERTLKRRDVDKRIIGNRRRLVYGYEIKIENLSPNEAKINIHDQIPVSRHEEVKVALESSDPIPTEQEELNLLKWELTLPVEGQQTIRFDFSVDHPRGLGMAGLP